MALPALLRKLFKSSGYGSELNDGIVSKTISNQDWSNSYDYPVGVVVRGSDDALYYSVAQSGPGTSAGAKDPAQGGNSGFWKSFGSGDSIPVGTVLWLSTPTVPAGFLLCNGNAVGRATYPDLFAAIGTTYGVGNGSTTFNLPNLIDKFAEGGAVAGVAKNAGLPNIAGKIDASAASSQFQSFGETIVSATAVTGPFELITGSHKATADTGGSELKMKGFTFDASRSNSIYGNSDTVQPPALTLLPCIKAYDSVDNISSLDAAQLESELQTFAGNVTPIGTVLWLSTPSVPAGYLLCNGAAVGRATYPELFTAIGTTYGSGDGSTTFNLPNLIDKFAEGGTIAGTVKAAGLPNITGTFTVEGQGGSNITGAFQYAGGANANGANGTDSYAYKNSFDASRSSAIYGNSNTVQPPALTLLPCIKAFSSVVGDATVIAGQLVNEIQSKVALDGSNLSGAAFKAVVETWHSGTEWYRVWSDGWCEQGGVFDLTSQNMFVQLYKPYNDTNFSILVSNSDSDTNNKINSSAWREKSTTGFYLFQGWGETFYAGLITWQAKGYIS